MRRQFSARVADLGDYCNLDNILEVTLSHLNVFIKNDSDSYIVLLCGSRFALFWFVLMTKKRRRRNNWLDTLFLSFWRQWYLFDPPAVAGNAVSTPGSDMNFIAMVYEKARSWQIAMKKMRVGHVGTSTSVCFWCLSLATNERKVILVGRPCSSNGVQNRQIVCKLVVKCTGNIIN